MEYRIIKETKANGGECFYVQKKVFGLIWLYITPNLNLVNSYTPAVHSLKEAENIIEQYKISEIIALESRIVKTEIIEYGK